MPGRGFCTLSYDLLAVLSADMPATNPEEAGKGTVMETFSVFILFEQGLIALHRWTAQRIGKATNMLHLVFVLQECFYQRKSDLVLPPFSDGSHQMLRR
jgi:hypothetical protein